MLPAIIFSAGFVFIFTGIILFNTPNIFNNTIRYFINKKLMWIATISRLGLGAIFMAGASYTQLPGSIFFLGMMIFTAGLLIPIFGKKRIKSMANWWIENSSKLKRTIGVLMGIIGGIITWSVIS
ncbi:MAG: hypothetical protein KTR26_11925 [Flammeovirgaceae bacterium]|nr:hypothetical protein [Flammeovirgaceae bacterium]